MDTIRSLAEIARDTIVRKNPFPRLDGMHTSSYGCKWGLTDLYPDAEEVLREAIENKATFDTGWIDCRKEIRAFRMISDGTNITIQASAEMDDIPELFYDALDVDTELTDDQISELTEYWYQDTEMSTDVISEQTVPVTTYADAMRILSMLEDQNDKQLNEWFEVIKSWVEIVVKGV